MASRKSPRLAEQVKEKDRLRLETEVRREVRKLRPKLDYVGHGLLLLLLLLTVWMYPSNWNSQLTEVDIKTVWYYGWITAVSTGLGVLPFVIAKPSKGWIGVSNAIAGGMMLAASYSLAYEGISEINSYSSNKAIMGDDVIDPLSNVWRTIAGFTLGILFILASKRFLDNFGDDISFGEIKGADAQKMLLIIVVMTLHSVSEGISIGVSFGSGEKLGQFISLSLAVHNVPEGLAVALVSTSKKQSTLRAGLWAVFTSLPQPIMAIPAFLFVKAFLPLLPAGLGFASGAMAYVAVFELLPEAAEDSSVPATALTGGLAFFVMFALQAYIKDAV